MDALLTACDLAKCDYKFVLNLNQCKVAGTVRGPSEAECTTFAFGCEYNNNNDCLTAFDPGQPG